MICKPFVRARTSSYGSGPAHFSLVSALLIVNLHVTVGIHWAANIVGASISLMAKTVRPHRLLHAAVWVVGAWSIFQLPWLLPSSRATYSDSYNVGFNNGVSTLAVGLIVAALIVLHSTTLRQKSPMLWRARVTRLLSPGRAHRTQPIEYLVPIGFAIFQAVAIWCWYAWLPQRYLGEVDYSFSRTELLLLGEVPLRDFQWNYGPLLLYIPAAIVRLSNYAIRLDTAYVMGLIITSTLGFVGVYYVIAQLRTTKRQRIVMFFLLCISFNMGLGCHSTYLRYVLPFAALFFFHRSVEARQCAHNPRDRRQLCLCAVLLCVLCFSLSADNGIAFYAGLLFYCIAQYKAGQRWFALCAFLALSTTLALVCLISIHYFRTLASFGTGGGNFPVYMTPHILFYLTSLFALMPFIGVCGWANATTAATWRQRDAGAMLAALCASGTLLAAGALGRCDANHVFTNGLIVFLLALALVWRRRFGGWYIVAFAVTFTLGANYFTWHLSQDDVFNALAAKRRGDVKLDRDYFAGDIETRNPQFRSVKAELLPLGHIGTPLPVGESMEIFLRYSGLYIPEYHVEPRSHVFNISQLQEKLRGVADMPYVLVETKALQTPRVDWNNANDRQRFESEMQRQLDWILMFPAGYSLKKTPFIPETQIRDYIQAHFAPIGAIADYTLMQNKNLKLPPKAK